MAPDDKNKIFTVDFELYEFNNTLCYFKDGIKNAQKSDGINLVLVDIVENELVKTEDILSFKDKYEKNQKYEENKKRHQYNQGTDTAGTQPIYSFHGHRTWQDLHSYSYSYWGWHY